MLSDKTDKTYNSMYIIRTVCKFAAVLQSIQLWLKSRDRSTRYDLNVENNDTFGMHFQFVQNEYSHCWNLVCFNLMPRSVIYLIKATLGFEDYGSGFTSMAEVERMKYMYSDKLVDFNGKIASVTCRQ
jgi:hypothetical protein